MQWEGLFGNVEARWLRWATAEGAVLPTPAEHAEQAHRAAEQAQRRITELEARLARYEQGEDRPHD